jgi:hypothetical protein
MTYSLIYPPFSLQMLAAAYLVALEDGLAAELTAASQRVDAALQTDPRDQGESRDGRKRVLIDRPLAVEFEVDDDQRVVVVLGVRYAPGKRQ